MQVFAPGMKLQNPQIEKLLKRKNELNAEIGKLSVERNYYVENEPDNIQKIGDLESQLNKLDNERQKIDVQLK